MSNTMSAGEARALLGAWQQIVGAAEAAALAPQSAQQAGVPTRTHHGAYGGHPHGGHRGFGGHAEWHGLHLPARNYITEMDPPAFARREVLPLNSGSTGVTAPNTLIITSRPQRPAYRPERMFVSGPIVTNSGLATGETASAWLIQDISIGNKSQFAQAGAIPGDIFANLSIDSFVSFDTVQTAMDVTVTVSYVGTSESAVSFFGGMLGTSAVHG